MNEADIKTIEKYQKLYLEAPSSKAFAPLSDAYRRAGMLEEAFQVAQEGVTKNPNFAGGRLALGRALLAQESFSQALVELEKAVALSPENLLAKQLVADTFIRLKRPKDALTHYKQLLFLAPDNSKAQKAIKKLESLTAADYDDEVFEMQNIGKISEDWYLSELNIAQEENSKNTSEGEAKRESRTLERYLSLSDAYFVRNDIDRTVQVLKAAERELGPEPEIVKRLKLIHGRHLAKIDEKYGQDAKALDPPLNRVKVAGSRKVDALKALLKQVTTRRKDI